MAYMFRRSATQATASTAMLLDAARCWRAARDAGVAVQPRLSSILRDGDGGILSPVLDSLLSFCESALGRRLRIGTATAMSDDEHLLLDLLGGSRRARASLTCPEAIAAMLDHALRSTRVMMRLALDPGPQPTAV